MSEGFWLAMERLFCTCWLYAGHDWPWRIPLAPGRDEDGVWRHSLGSTLWRVDNHFAMKAYHATNQGVRSA